MNEQPKHTSPFKRVERIQQMLFLSPTSAKQALVPDRISLRQVDRGTLETYKKSMTKASWSMTPGRALSFLVVHDMVLLGIIYLASPVARLRVRDAFLGLSKPNSTERMAPLREYLELSCCVGAQPLAWYWNVGKLCAQLARTVGDEYTAAYGDEFRGVFTTSLWGKGSQYNRIYKFLGYSEGVGTDHITPAQRAEAQRWLNLNAPEVSKSKKTMVKLRKWSDATGQKGLLEHGKHRGVWYGEAIASSFRDSVIHEWYQRWGLPRWERVQNDVSPYTSGFGLSD